MSLQVFLWYKVSKIVVKSVEKRANTKQLETTHNMFKIELLYASQKHSAQRTWVPVLGAHMCVRGNLTASNATKGTVLEED